jgi:hypothetical protein
MYSGLDNKPINDAEALARTPKGDTFFASADDWYHNACVNWLPDAWDAYATGYMCAGNILVGHIVDTHRDRDTLVFPIVFNYRQYIELRLKGIIRSGRRLLGEQESFPRTHDLRLLWSICRALISEIEPNSSETEIEVVDEAIAQFCLVDLNSDCFRYPVDRNGNRSLPDTLRLINLRQLRDSMEHLAGFFDAVSGIFSVYLDRKYKMENYI